MKLSLNHNKILFLAAIIAFSTLMGCKDDDMPTPIVEPEPSTNTGDTTTLDDGPVDFSNFSDTYAGVATPAMTDQWRHYNVHDPSYVVDDEFTYCYNTDVAFGHEIRAGIQIRRSINLVEWEFVGWAFPGIPSQGGNYIRQNGGEPNPGLWAPYIMKVNDEYRLYYSLASNVPRLSAIGLATSDDPRGPFVEQGLVVTSQNDGSTHTNAIDPTVIVTDNGEHWMYYGSSWDAIYRLQLNPSTGLSQNPNDKGVRIAHRGFTGNTINGNIEAPEIIHNPEFDQYYMFIAYDWLETKYNVRVGRSDSPTGPFFDIEGKNMNELADDDPMILAPYRFEGHSGWQGVSHPGVFEKDGRFYMGHQGRPGVNPFFMVMHVRQLFWTEDGWPLVSCQRYATEEETAVEEAELIGNWDQITYEYQIVPGFAEEQLSPNYIDSEPITLEEGGTISGSTGGTWSYSSPWLNLAYDNGTTARVRVERGRDWENEVPETVLFTGLNDQNITVWGKKLQ